MDHALASPTAPTPLHRDATASLVAAHEAVALYGAAHPSTRAAIESASRALTEAHHADGVLRFRVTPGGIEPALDAAGPQPSRLARTLDGLDIVAITVSEAPRAGDIEQCLHAIATAARERSDGDLDAAPTLTGKRIVLHRLAYESLRVDHRAGSSHAPGITWDHLARLAEHGYSDRLEDEILQLIDRCEVEGKAPAASIAHALRETGNVDERERIAGALRSCLGGISNDLQDRLLATGSDKPTSVDDLAELADVLPVAQTCRALTELSDSQRVPSLASVRMFRRLAMLVQGNGEDMRTIAQQAMSWSERPSSDPDEARRISDIAELCAEFAACDFIPDDYGQRLDEIAGADARQSSAALTELDRGDDGAGAARVLVEIATATPELIDLGMLDRLGALVPGLAEPGHIEIILQIARIAHPLTAHADPDVSSAASTIVERSSDPDLLAMAVQNCECPASLETGRAELAAVVGAQASAVIESLITRELRPTALTFARELVATLDDRAFERIVARVFSSAPHAFAVLVPRLGTESAERVFDLLRAALQATPPERCAIVYQTALQLEHPWPASLVERGLIEPDPDARRAAAAYIRDREPDRAVLLRERVLGALGGPTPSRSERQHLAGVLTEIDKAQQTGHRRAVLTAAALRPTIRAARGADAVCRELNASKLGTPLVWTLSPVRLLARIPERSPGGTP